MINKTSSEGACLFYPFSRCLDEATLKHLCLVFDSITFLDEASSTWRTRQFAMMSQHDDQFFSKYGELAKDYGLLSEAGIISVVDPTELVATHSTQVALATIADLQDPLFLDVASDPSAYGLPARPLAAYESALPNKMTWQVYQGKIASPLREDNRFAENKLWASQVIRPGSMQHHWVLSYEAGSAAVTNFYLEAADELGLTPVTTSQLHHSLVLRKLRRAFSEKHESINYLDSKERRRLRQIAGQGEILRLFDSLFPAEQLQEVSFEQILQFRQETQILRQEYVNEIHAVLRVIDSDPSTATYEKAIIESITKLKTDLLEIENELAAIRDKILPAIAKSLLYGTAGSGLFSSFLSFLGGLSPGGVIAVSALTVSAAFLTEAVNIWNERREVLRKQSPSVAYLAKLNRLTGEKGRRPNQRSLGAD